MTAGSISKIVIQVQYDGSLAGCGLEKHPIIMLTDRNGNRQNEDLAGGFWNVSIFVHAPSVPDTHTSRINRRNRDPDVIKTIIRTSSDIMKFGSIEYRELVMASQAAKGYKLAFSFMIEPVFEVLSTEFKVLPCAVAHVSMMHSVISVAAGDSICGARGSAWEEEVQVENISMHCTCAVFDPLGTYIFRNTVDEEKCARVCVNTFSGMNGTVSHLDLTGNSQEGVRSWVDDFHEGSSVIINTSTPINETVVSYNASTGVFVVSWTKATDDASGTNLRNALTRGIKLKLFLNETRVENQEHRCIFDVKDSYRNLVDSHTLIATARLLHSVTLSPNKGVFLGKTTEISVDGLVTFPEMYVTVAGDFVLEISIVNADTNKSTETKFLSTSHLLHVVHGLRSKIILRSTSDVFEGKVGEIVPVLLVAVGIVDAHGNAILDSSCLGISIRLSDSALVSNGLWGTSLRSSTNAQVETCEKVPGLKAGGTLYITCHGTPVDVIGADLETWPGPCSFAVDTVDGIAEFKNLTTTLSATQSAYPLMLEFISFKIVR